MGCGHDVRPLLGRKSSTAGGTQFGHPKVKLEGSSSILLVCHKPNSVIYVEDDSVVPPHVS